MKYIDIINKLKDKEILDFPFISSWLDTFKQEHQYAIETSNCKKWKNCIKSNESPYPCVCTERETDCLFIEVYHSLQKTLDLRKDEDTYKYFLSNILKSDSSETLYQEIKSSIDFKYMLDYDVEDNIIFKFKYNIETPFLLLKIDSKEISNTLFCNKLSSFLIILKNDIEKLSLGSETIKTKKEKLDSLPDKSLKDKVLFNKNLTELVSLKLAVEAKKEYLFDFIKNKKRFSKFDIYYNCYKPHK